MRYRPMFRAVALASGLALAGCAPRYALHPEPAACMEARDLRTQAEPPDSLIERDETSRDLEEACAPARATSEHDRDDREGMHGPAAWWMMGPAMLAGGLMWLIMAGH